MPRDVSGNTQPLPGTIVSTGDTILPSQHNPMVNDVYAMMTQSLSRDGQGGMRAPLDMSNFRIVNVGAATQPSDAVSLSQFQTGTPIGCIVDFSGASAPDTWLLCYGQAVSRTSYAALFSVIGTTYGAGDGSSTFNLPDLRGRVSAGKDDMGGTDAARLSNFYGSLSKVIGGILGASFHILTSGQMPNHNHNGTTDVDGLHTHSYPVDSGGGGGSSWQGGFRAPATAQTGQAGAHQHTFVTSSVGGGEAHPNAQPTIIFNKIIKASL